jgi:hypothetical protein
MPALNSDIARLARCGAKGLAFIVSDKARDASKWNIGPARRTLSRIHETMVSPADSSACIAAGSWPYP